MAKEKQAEMEFSHTFPVDKMGMLIDPHVIYLLDSFLQDNLEVSQIDAGLGIEKRKEVTKVGCPFCKKGFLKLVSVEPSYSGGPGPAPMTQYHVANKYEYVCSDDTCDARFFGEYQWMWVD